MTLFLLEANNLDLHQRKKNEKQRQHHYLRRQFQH